MKIFKRVIIHRFYFAAFLTELPLSFREMLCFSCACVRVV